MRLLRLSFSGIGPFPGRQDIDFEEFEPEGIMLITGPTGGGKTTILDAVVFALYGRLSSQNADPARMRSTLCAPTEETWVELDFEVSSGQYRVRRSPAYERPKKRGDGFTLHRTTAHLIRIDDPANPLATRPVDVGPAILELVGLTGEQFCQTVILPQGKFDTFLRAKSDDRKKVLESIFRTQDYARFEDALRESAKDAQAVAKDASAALNSAWSEYLDQIQEKGIELSERSPHAARAAVAQAMDASVETAKSGLAKAKDQEQKAAAALTHGEQVIEAKAQFSLLKQTLHTLEQEASLRERQQLTLDAAARSKEVLGKNSIHEHDLAAKEDAEQAVTEAEEILTQAVAEVSFYRGDLREKAGQYAAELAPLVGVEADLKNRQEELHTLQDKAAAASKGGQECSAKAAKAHQVVEHVKLQVLASQNASKAMQEHGEKLEKLQAQHQAHEEWKEAAKALSDAAEQKIAAARAWDTAKSKEAHLVTQRLQGLASQVASHLQDGVPCPACGSLSHPHPAEEGAQTVSLDRLSEAYKETARAEELFNAAKSRHEQALERTTKAQAEISIAQEVLAPQLQLERTLFEQAERQANKLEGYQNKLQEEQNKKAQYDTEVALNKQALQELQQRIHSLTESISKLKGQIAPLTQNGITVRQLHDKLVQIHTLGDRQLLNIKHLEHAKVAAETSGEELIRSLKKNNFPTVEDAQKAALDKEAESGLRSQIADWKAQKQSCSQRLSEPKLVALAAENSPDTVALQNAKDSATATADAQNQQLGKLLAERDQLLRAVERISSATDHLDSLTAEHKDLLWLFELVNAGPANQDSIPLSTWVLLERLNQILAVANPHLQAMSAGRYELVRTDSDGGRSVNQALSLAVRDHYSDTERKTSSLSGGEMFYCSLALSLALAEVVSYEAGGIVIQTMLIDEGFGSLDPQKLDSVMDQLRVSSAGRLVGIISHVRELANQVGPKVQVIASEQGSRLKLNLPTRR